MVRLLDRRRKRTCWLVIMAVVADMGWFWLSAAIAAALPETREQAITQGDLLRGQWWLIASLIGAVVTLLQTFSLIIYSGIKTNVRTLFELHRETHEYLRDKVLTHTHHSEIDHSPLCPTCRTNLTPGGKR